MMFAKIYSFSETMAHFVDKRHGPAWFQIEFPTRNPAQQDKFGKPFSHKGFFQLGLLLKRLK